jgi:large subunit ribosomal protein L15
MPLQRRLPKRGFTNIHRIEVQTVNVGDLVVFDGSQEITRELLKEQGLIRKADAPVKLLGKGTIRKALTVKVNHVSDGARKKLEQAGGSVELISR